MKPDTKCTKCKNVKKFIVNVLSILAENLDFRDCWNERIDMEQDLRHDPAKN